MDKQLQELKERFENYTSLPPEEAWNVIAQAQQKRRRVIPFWLRMGMVASVLFIVGLGIFFFTNYSKNSKNSIADNTKHTHSNPKINKNNTVVPSVDSASYTNVAQSTANSGQNINYNLNKKVAFPSSTPINLSKKQNATIDVSVVKNQSAEKQPVQSLEEGKKAPETQKVIDENVEQQIELSIRENTQLTDNKDFENPSNTIKNKDNQEISDDLALNESREIQKNVDEKLEKIADKAKKSFAIMTYASPVIPTQFSGYEAFSNFKSENSLSSLYGVKAEFAITPKWKVRAGIEYMNIQQNYEEVLLGNCIDCVAVSSVANPNTEYYTPVDTETGKGTVPAFTEPAYSGNITQRISYWSIPIDVEYPLWNYKKFTLSGMGGISALILNQNQLDFSEDTEYLNIDNDNTDELNKAVLGWQLGVKTDWNLYQNFSWFVEPQMRYYLPLMKNDAAEKPLIFTINTGLKIQF